nr:unnamed protein product [Digitaria exilis]
MSNHRHQSNTINKNSKKKVGAGEEDDHHHLRRQIEEDVRAWKARHREKAAAAARLVVTELDGERVGKNLAVASLRAATRELERERAARERVEEVCDELAAGVAVAEEALRRDGERSLVGGASSAGSRLDRWRVFLSGLVK